MEIGTDSSGMGMYAVIDPLADIPAVKDVLVITSFAGQGEQAL